MNFRTNHLSTTVLFLLATWLCGGMIRAADEPAEVEPNEKDAKLVAEVTAGKRATANAAWWGFDPKDSTAALQAAVNSGAKKLVVPNMGGDWIVSRTITLAGDQEIVFQPGVTVSAMRGKFIGGSDALVHASNKRNIVLRGPGATLRMHKADYHKPPYKKAEWRHTLSIRGCQNVEVHGLELRDSGGDGIYLGATSENRLNKDILIRNVTCDGNNRQGISVITAENLLVENCRFANTSGTAPQAGIDLEPNHPDERLVNCVIRNCLVENNTGPGIYAYLKHLSGKSADISIRVENCVVKNCGSFGIGGGAVCDDGPAGLFEFINVSVSGTNGPGVYVFDKSAARATFRFAQCSLKNTARKHGHPLYVQLRRPELTKKHGGVEFVNCTVADDRDRPLLVVRAKSDLPVAKIRGNIKATNPAGATIDLGPKHEDVDLKVQ